MLLLLLTAIAACTTSYAASYATLWIEGACSKFSKHIKLRSMAAAYMAATGTQKSRQQLCIQLERVQLLSRE